MVQSRACFGYATFQWRLALPKSNLLLDSERTNIFKFKIEKVIEHYQCYTSASLSRLWIVRNLNVIARHFETTEIT